MRRLMAILLACAAGPAAAQFDTAAEVKPILQMIKPQWISVREFDGKDLVYFTLLEVYRCGLTQIRYIVNDGKPQVWETEPCEGDAVFSEIGEDRLPYAEYPLGHIRKVRIELSYDDGTSEWMEYPRGDVLQ